MRTAHPPNKRRRRASGNPQAEASAYSSFLTSRATIRHMRQPSVRQIPGTNSSGDRTRCPLSRWSWGTRGASRARSSTTSARQLLAASENYEAPAAELPSDACKQGSCDNLNPRAPRRACWTKPRRWRSSSRNRLSTAMGLRRSSSSSARHAARRIRARRSSSSRISGGVVGSITASFSNHRVDSCERSPPPDTWIRAAIPRAADRTASTNSASALSFSTKPIAPAERLLSEGWVRMHRQHHHAGVGRCSRIRAIKSGLDPSGRRTSSTSTCGW